MGKITKPGKVKLNRAPRRPAWLYPEGTRHVSDNGEYLVAREVTATGDARSRRYWKEA